MIQPLTIKELDRIREKERPALEKALRERKSIPPEKKPLCYFEVGRYVGGDITGPSGLWYAAQTDVAEVTRLRGVIQKMIDAFRNLDSKEISPKSKWERIGEEFAVAALAAETEAGSKTLADGVDMHVIASEVRAAIHATLDRKASGK